MSRETKLIASVLFLIIGGILYAIGSEPMTQVQRVLTGTFVLLGLVFGALGLRVRFAGAQARHVVMVFVGKELATGLAITLVSAGAVTLVANAGHVLPAPIAAAALLGVPCGLFVAAGCWTQACRLCRVPLRRATTRSGAFQYCPKCRSVVLLEKPPSEAQAVTIGNAARTLIEEATTR